MKLIKYSLGSAPLNLALEELYFDHFEEESLRLWINPQAVVIGKHQNALAECNFHHCLQHGIPMLRRISGGGTVYHDPGNVNFSFFRMVDKDKMIDYDRNLVYIAEALQSMGYPVEMNARHDLYLEGKKISGNAQHLRKGKSLHHGTILYDADLHHLRDSIKRSRGNFVDKAVKSVRSPIANLRAFKDLGSTDAFLELLHGTLMDMGMLAWNPPPISVDALHTLAKDRYGDDAWNFGYSPAYTYSLQEGNIEIELEVARGGDILSAAVVINGSRKQWMEETLRGNRHFFSLLKDLAPQDEPRHEEWKGLLGYLF